MNHRDYTCRVICIVGLSTHPCASCEVSSTFIIKNPGTLLTSGKFCSSTGLGLVTSLRAEARSTCLLDIGQCKLMDLYKSVGVGVHSERDSEIVRPPGG